jgi:glycosyltransferase involved in cell wall biosynthesis
MKSKKIIIVAMLDSIHTARWLSQFKDQDIDFIIIASKKFKHIHPQLRALLDSKSLANFKLRNFGFAQRFAGYLDFLFFVIPQRYFHLSMRKYNLISALKKKDLHFIHALEIQGAGYLVDSALKNAKTPQKFILTNWGSDIYFYQNYPEHKALIQSALHNATHYSAECKRDYELAKLLGFNGVELPCIPNAGGFDLSVISNQTSTSSRSNIVAKAYGGDFGRGDLIIQSLNSILISYPEVTTYLYSVTDDLLTSAENLKSQFPGRVSFSARRNPLSRAQMQELFLQSRIYIGASRTDGISTSFLEALISGCYPIQTNTSCADEWVKLGATASLVGMDSDQISLSIQRVLRDDAVLNNAQINNWKIAEAYLSESVIKPIALNFYNY